MLRSHSGTGYYVAFRVIVWTESEQERLRLCSHSDTGYYVAFRVIVWTESEQQRPGTGASRLHTSKASIWVVKFCRLQTDAKTEPSCTAQLKELCHEIYQNVNGGNCDQIKWNMKISAQIIIKSESFCRSRTWYVFASNGWRARVKYGYLTRTASHSHIVKLGQAPTTHDCITQSH